MTRQSVSPADAARAERFEARTAWPMFVLALLFLAASTWLFAGDDKHPWLVALLGLVVIGTWVAFIAQFVVRFLLNRHGRLQFLRANWFELVSLVIPYLRPFVIVLYIWRLPVFQRSSATLRARYVISVVTFALLFVYVGSTLVWLFEKDAPHATIVNLGDAIWWGATTITTVGYGDFTPITFAGRFIAILMMVGGIAVLGVASATIVSLLSDQIARRNHAAAHGHKASHRSTPATPPAPGLEDPPAPSASVSTD